ncbi:MAG TPA: SdrD B-like domain-containing protein [Chloroflexota bacterium]|nr:SdrD B-like domain-containing protein [Chloroflexota bacterium]
MRAWIQSTALAAVLLGALPAAALAAPTATPTAKAQPSAAPTAAPPPKPSATPTNVPPPSTATAAPPTATAAPPTATAAPPTATAAPSAGPSASGATPLAGGQSAAAPGATASSATAAPTGTAQATVVPSAIAGGSPTPSPDQPVALVAAPPGSGAIHGAAFFDADANGERSASEPTLSQVDITLSAPGGGLVRTVRTGDDGSFTFTNLAQGTYRLTVAVPIDYVPTTDTGQDVEVEQDTQTDGILFGLISLQAAGLKPDGTPEQDPNAQSDDEQIIALASVSSLPLRFAEGRDLMAQVGRRVLGDGLVWLGVPFRTQIDGGEFQFVNCGPASLTMVLAGFGLEVGPSQVRDYLNNLIDNFNTDLGTSLDVLSRIGKDAGLTPMDLYSDRGGYRNWSTDAVRWHIQQGHPVITLVKYRNLPGHTKSLSEFDHYIVISGLTPNGFIYNDAAFASTLGYGLEISDVELEYAWDNSSIPRHALAFGLAPDARALTFPELPRKPRTVASDAVAPARGARRLAQADETVRAPLTLTPVLTPLLPTQQSAGPLIGRADNWQDDPDFQPLDLSTSSPMGLQMEPTEQPTLEPRPGPGTMVPKLLTILGALWLLWTAWSLNRGLANRLNRLKLTPIRNALSALLSLFN